MEDFEQKIPDTEFEPFLFLEGQQWLNETEEILVKTCIESKIFSNVITGLYDDPDQIKSIDFLKPKSIVLGTTGVYRESLQKILDVFATCEHLPDHIFLTMGEEVLCGVIRKYKEVKPDIKVWKVYPLSRYFKGDKKAPVEEITWI